MRNDWIKLRALKALNPGRIARADDRRKVLRNLTLIIGQRITWLVTYDLSNPSGLPDAKYIAESSGRSVRSVKRDIRELRRFGYIRRALPGETCRVGKEEIQLRGEVCCWPYALSRSAMKLRARGRFRLPPEFGEF